MARSKNGKKKLPRGRHIHSDNIWNFLLFWLKKGVGEYDQEIPQSHTADQPTALRGRATEHPQQQDIR